MAEISSSSSSFVFFSFAAHVRMSVCISLGPVGDSRLHRWSPQLLSLMFGVEAGTVCYQHILSHAASVLLCVLDAWCDSISHSLALSLHPAACVCARAFEYAYLRQICGQLSVALDDSVSL